MNTRHGDTSGSIAPSGEIRIARHGGPPPWIMGGVLFGGATGATFLGPIGALAGMAIGAGLAALSVRHFASDRR